MGTPQEEKSLTFRILYHPQIQEDLNPINRNIQARLESAILHRLAKAPQAYGKPLSATLSGFWKMRVGDYRVVFKIVKREIWILAIIHRKDVYSQVVKRLGWQPEA